MRLAGSHFIDEEMQACHVFFSLDMLGHSNKDDIKI